MWSVSDVYIFSCGMHFFLTKITLVPSFKITYFRIALESHVEPSPVLLFPAENGDLILDAWCNWGFEETSLLPPDAFSCQSGSDYRVDARVRVDIGTGCVWTHSHTHGNNYSVWGIGRSVFISLCLSACLCVNTASLTVVLCQWWHPYPILCLVVRNYRQKTKVDWLNYSLVLLL